MIRAVRRIIGVIPSWSEARSWSATSGRLMPSPVNVALLFEFACPLHGIMLRSVRAFWIRDSACWFVLVAADLDKTLPTSLLWNSKLIFFRIVPFLFLWVGRGGFFCFKASTRHLRLATKKVSWRHHRCFCVLVPKKNTNLFIKLTPSASGNFCRKLQRNAF